MQSFSAPAGGAAEPIRIVFAELPRMLRDILHASVADEPELELVGEASNLEDLKRLVEHRGVDVVILSLADSELPESHYGLFEADAWIRILAIAGHGRNASLYEMRPHRAFLQQGSPEELLRIVREHVRTMNGRALSRARDGGNS
jgi:DNA-binding NarL/FixJ family response regulator